MLQGSVGVLLETCLKQEGLLNNYELDSILLLMVQKSGVSPVEVGSLSHYLHGF